MGNTCCGNAVEWRKHGAWADADTVDENCSYSDHDDNAYNANATVREQLITLHVGSRRRISQDVAAAESESEGTGTGTGEIGTPTRRNNGTTKNTTTNARLKRPSISSTPVDFRAGSSSSFVAPSFPKSIETTEMLLKAMGDNFVFDSISEEAKLRFAKAMQPHECDEGEWVVRQGDAGDYFYILAEGEVAFHVSSPASGSGEPSSSLSSSAERDPSSFLPPPVVGRGSRGTTFGELALLYDAPRAASVRALTPLRLYKIDHLTFRSLLTSSRVEDRSNLISLIRRSSAFRELDEARVRKLADAFAIVDFGPGERVVNKGDSGNVLYIVRSGEVRVEDVGRGSSRFRDHVLSEGDCFGERALITGEPRAANVTAATASSLLAVSKDALEDIIGPLEQAVRQSYLSRWLGSIPLFEFLERDEIDRCVKRLKNESFAEGDKISTAKGKLYMIEEGRALMLIQKRDGIKDARDGKNKEISMGPTMVKFEKGDFFGDLWGSYKESNRDSNKVKTEDTLNVEADMKCLTLLTSDVESIIGNMRRLSTTFNPEKMKRGSNTKRRSRMSILKDMQSNSSHFDRVKIKRGSSIRNVSNLTKLNKHRILGAGTFGKVWLVTPKSTNKEKTTAYALKMVSKRQLLDQNLATAILREKNVMESIEHPFLLHMVSSFQDENYLYFVMDLILGGELFELMYPDGRKSINCDENSAWKKSAFYNSFGEMEEKPARGLAGVGVRKAAFFSANIIEAFVYLHNRQIVYRDLKPENIMLNEKGYCVIVDMGFAKVVLDKTYTLCGTLEYLAPEVIANQGHNHVADYWSFGCVLYELIVGQTPFSQPGMSQLTLFKNIVKARYSFPDIDGEQATDGSNSFNKELCNWKDLVSSLLKPRSVKRRGNLRNGIEDILDHDWFANVDFNELRNQSLPAPWVPTIVDPLNDCQDVYDFAEQEEQEAFKRRLSSKEQEIFKGF